jgi:hypothetical protein
MNDGREGQETLDPGLRPSTSLGTVSLSTLLGAVSLSNGLSNGRGEGSSQAETQPRHSWKAGIQDSQGDLPPVAGLPLKSRPALAEKSEMRCDLFSDLIHRLTGGSKGIGF